VHVHGKVQRAGSVQSRVICSCEYRSISHRLQPCVIPLHIRMLLTSMLPESKWLFTKMPMPDLALSQLPAAPVTAPSAHLLQFESLSD